MAAVVCKRLSIARVSGLVDNWLFQIRDIHREYRQQLVGLAARPLLDRMCELNVIEQVRNLAKTTIIQSAWDRGQEVKLHGWVYSIEDGLVRDMNVTVDSRAALDEIYHFES